MSAREMRALADAIYREIQDCRGKASSTEGQILLRLSRAHHTAADQIDIEARAAPAALAALSTIKALIGNVDHSKGHGPNAAEMRGGMLNDIRDLCDKALKP